MRKFKVKFFGSKKEREQIKQVKTVLEAENRADVERVIKSRLGYKVVNGLKIHEYEGGE